MKKLILTVMATALLPAAMSAQSAVDAYQLSQTDLRGTARFMSMGGAFTALGGDLSTLNQNPAGIGVYRRSEIGATLDITPRRMTTQSATDQIRSTQTKVGCNNFGYVGTVRFDSGALRTFSWGATYNRVASFDRVFTGYDASTQGSLTNYIASFTNGTPQDQLNFGGNDSFNPYLDGTADWLSILANCSYMINPVDGFQTRYQGLYGPQTQGDALAEVRQKGYVDEYAIDFGGNLAGMLMWGIGFGITDLQFNQTAVYSESLENAVIASERGMATGNAGFELGNYTTTSGNGFNLKLGLIFKPINELRIGAAIHTPTWYALSTRAYADVDYSYYCPTAPSSQYNPLHGNEYTDDADYRFHLTSPWKFMIGAAGVIGNSAIVSVDYERQAYNDTKLSYQNGWETYVADEAANANTKAYFKGTDILRMGVEYRLTPSWSLRAGYAHQMASTKQEVSNGNVEVSTAGMNPAYTLHKASNSLSVGIGFHYMAFYIDAAYVHRQQDSDYFAYTPYPASTAADARMLASPRWKLTDVTNSAVVSLGFRF